MKKTAIKWVLTIKKLYLHLHIGIVINQIEKKPNKEKKAKDFIQSCGEAWQCILCNKVLSNRVKALFHIEDLHHSSLFTARNDTDKSDSSHLWMCNICKLKASDKVKLIVHVQNAHVITKRKVIEKTITNLKPLKI